MLSNRPDDDEEVLSAAAVVEVEEGPVPLFSLEAELVMESAAEGCGSPTTVEVGVSSEVIVETYSR